MLKNDIKIDKAKEILSELKKFITTETVIGKPIVTDDMTIIPLVDVTFGVGVGFNQSKSEGIQGGGAGATMSPNSLLIIQNGETKLLSIKDSASVATLIPQILDRLNFEFLKKENE